MKHLIVIFFLIYCVYAKNGTNCKTDNNCDEIDFVCKRNKCTCRDGFALINNSTCTKIISHNFTCVTPYNCNQQWGNSTCLNKTCVCVGHHHLINRTCIKNRGLFESCTNQDQCYWGMDMTPKMSCISGKCDCKKGFHEFKHKCSGGDSNTATILLITITAVLGMIQIFSSNRL